MSCHSFKILPFVYFFVFFASGLCQGQESSAPAPKEITNSIGMKLVFIPAGRFTMGSPVDEPHSRPNETLHKVEISKPFYMGCLEVTEQQFAQVMGIEPRVVQQKNTNGRVIGNKVIPFTAFPVSSVNWFDANEFCVKLSSIPDEKKEQREYRLPSEAEWEYACRAGTQSAYSFGDNALELGNYGWYRGNAGTNRNERIKLGGQKRPNAWGLYDMHGNAHEWCVDLYANYREGFIVDPLIRARGGVMIMSKVISRGGGSNSSAEFCRSAYRNSPYADDPGGFRVVMRVSAAKEAKE